MEIYEFDMQKVLLLFTVVAWVFGGVLFFRTACTYIHRWRTGTELHFINGQLHKMAVPASWWVVMGLCGCFLVWRYFIL
jgi:hypothetical protein